MIPSVGSVGPLSAFNGSGGFNAGTQASEAKGSSDAHLNFNFGPPQTTVGGINTNSVMIAAVAVAALWILKKK